MFGSRMDALVAAVERAMVRVEFDPSGIVIDAKTLFLDLVGLTRAEVCGRPHAQSVTEAERAGPEYATFWDRLRTGRHMAGDFTRLTKSGQTIRIYGSYNPVLDRHGKVIKVVKLATDVTEERARSARHAGWIAALDRSQAVISFTLDGIIIDANTNFLTTLGYVLAEVRGQHHPMFLPADEAAGADYAAFWAALGAGRYQAGEFRRVGKGGRAAWIFGTYNPIFDADEKPCAVVKFATDVTQQVEDRQRRAGGSARHRLADLSASR